MILALRRLFLTLFVSIVIASQVEASPPGPKDWSLAPGVELLRSALSFSEAGAGQGQELASGLSFSLRLISGTNLAETFSVSLDLRQSFARSDGRRDLGLLATRLGVRGDWLLSETWWFGATWYFGDTVVVRHHDRQYNGTSTAFSLSMRGAGAAVWFLQFTFGSYQEGPGFIALSRRPGDDGLHLRSLGVGVEFPFQPASWGGS